MVTLVTAVGTPPHQLLAVFQSPDVPPTQVPVEFTVTVTVLLICTLHAVLAFVASTLNVVVDDKVPVGKLIVPPVPATAPPMAAFVALLRNW